MQNDQNCCSDSEFKEKGLAALETSVTSSLGSSTSVHAEAKKIINKDSGGPYNILMIVSDQERYMAPNEFLDKKHWID